MFTTVAGLRDDYREAATALRHQLGVLADAAANLRRLIATAEQAQRAALERIRVAQALIAAAEAAMSAAADAEDDEAYEQAAVELAVAQAELAVAQAEYEQARVVKEEATRRQALVERAIAATVEAQDGVAAALHGLDRHRPMEEAVAGHPGVAQRTAAYAPTGDSR